MLFFVALLALACVCDARPSSSAHPATFELGFGNFIINGKPADPGQFPHQLSQERLGGAWSHSCGSSLLSANKALTAAHCIDGAAVTIIRVVAGLHYRSNPGATDAQYSVSNSLKIHEQYGAPGATFNNDIGIIGLAFPIDNTPDNIDFATLPPDNSQQYDGTTVILSGWGRTSASNVLPDELQMVEIPCISNAQCNTLMAPVSGANVGPGQMCFYDGSSGSCNGDSGGPAHANHNGEWVVAGVTSWGIQGGGACLPSYPSAYTRVGFFLQWIEQNL